MTKHEQRTSKEVILRHVMVVVSLALFDLLDLELLDHELLDLEVLDGDLAALTTLIDEGTPCTPH